MFNVAWRRVIDPDLPEPVRFGAFLWCLEFYCWLTRQSFQDTYIRFGDQIGFDWERKPNASQLVEAAELLMTERRAFLAKLESFSSERREEKAAGKREPGQSRIESLYTPDWLATRSREGHPDISFRG